MVYVPHVVTLLLQPQSPPDTTVSSPPGVLAENMPLFLPSSLPPHIRALPELKEICKLEHRLREPQADDALAEVRRQRRIIQGMWHFKRLNVSGTGNRPNTRMLSLYQRFNNKTDRAAQKYRVTWRVLSVLDPNGSWSRRLKELKAKDVSGPGRDPDDATASNSRYELSWIWLVQHARHLSPAQSKMHIGEDEFNQSMKIWLMEMTRWRNRRNMK